MSDLDELNLECRKYAQELTDKWMFTGWKLGQGNFRLHAQWFRYDDYKGERYYSSIQCLPVEYGDINDPKLFLKHAKDNMKLAIDEISFLTSLAPEPIPMPKYKQ